MKKTRITITQNLEKTQYHFMVLNPDKLSSIEVEMIKAEMGVEMVFVNGKLYRG
ncbi:hypothetical protein [Flavobacterium sp.]|uniref:hypothetical protein n=1 Tax=Flavobacterium sp. TaxID=239 RepID=UPI0035AE1241